MFSLFFIKRPIMAMVISIVIMLAGLVAYRSLPVAQYPDLTPPTIRVTAYYYGASAQTISDTVAAPIEQAVNGVDRMIYMTSTSSGDGSYQLDITFELGVNPDTASVLVQNKLNSALAKLPQEVQRQGVTVQKRSASMVGIITLACKDEQSRRLYDDLYLANYITLNVKDELFRTKGVGDISVVPTRDYGMRIWLDPAKLKARDMTVNDAIDALRAQNVQVAAGRVGAAPAPQGTAFTYQITTLGRLETERQFDEVIVKTGSDGGITRLKDIARVELGSKSYDTTGTINGAPGAFVIVYQAPGGNAVQVSDDLKAKIAKMQKDLPPGLELAMKYDIAVFINTSIHEVYKTLFEAIILVVIVVLVFLGSLRTTFIPILVIPVALLGTFVGMAVFGFSVNMLTLFGLILAIGIVVDDAIVVVENVERNMAEHHLPPKDATARAMGEVFGAVIAISLVLMAVFVPTAALPGITGQLYRQFALTIAVSTALSALCALTLSPALAGLILKAHKPGHKPNFFNRGFNWVFDKISGAYATFIRQCVRPSIIAFALLAFAAVSVLTIWSMKQVPKGFLPTEDRGLVMVDVVLPDSASLERSQAVADRLVDIIRHTEGVQDVVGYGGYSMLNGTGTNYAMCFAILKDWEERLPHGRDLATIMADIRKQTASIQEAQFIVFTLPAIDGLGNASGFDMRVQDRTGLGRPTVQQVTSQMVADANSQRQLRSVFSAYRAGVPQLFADIDREKALKLGIPLQQVFDTLATYLGSAYINDFNKFGRTWQVNAQADAIYRARIEDIRKLEVRNTKGEMIPLSTIMRTDRIIGPDRVYRYNLYPNAIINGEPAPGVSSGQSLDLMEQIADQNLAPGMSYEWTGMAFQEKAVSGQAGLVFLMAIVVVYLILAAQYESWTDPIAVVLSIPLAVLGAMTGLMYFAMDNNVYTQIGLVLLVGLGAKNAILIVEFARENIAKGTGLVDATVDASRQRLRPILMTSFAFIAGVYPLVGATGAGAASRQALGTAVFFGMIGNTLLGLLFTPILFVAVRGATGLFRRRPAREPAPAHAGASV